MASHQIECSEPWFSLIRDSVKKVEGRKNTERWAKIKELDTLVFLEKESKVEFITKVTKVVKYAAPNALRKYLEGETVAKALPGVTTMEEGMKIYLQWSTMKEIEDSGAMLGIHVEVVKEEPIKEGLPLPE